MTSRTRRSKGSSFPDSTLNGAPLICDLLGLLSRPLPVERLRRPVRAGQKNAGPAGMVVVLRETLLEHIPNGLPTMLDDRTLPRAFLYNTPPAVRDLRPRTP